MAVVVVAPAPAQGETIRRGDDHFAFLLVSLLLAFSFSFFVHRREGVTHNIFFDLRCSSTKRHTAVNGTGEWAEW